MMWKSQFCISWLQERYEENDECEVSLKSLYSRYKNDGGTLSKIALGKYIQSFFPKASSYKKWFSEDKRQSSMYKNLGEKIQQPELEITEFSVLKQWVPSPFFVCKDDENKVQFAMFCDLVNGNKLVKKITFCKDGKWQLHIGENEVNLEEIEIENTFSISRSSVHDICSIILKLKTCKGKEKENCSLQRKKSIVIEFLGDERTQIFRSLYCNRTVPFTASATTCRPCQHYIKVHEIEQSNKGVEEPVSSSDEENNVVLTQNNDADMREILERVLPEASGEMLDLLVIQKQNLARNPKGRRWDKKTLSICLSLWCRSKKNYQQLRDSKVLILPSGVTLGLYKRAVEQNAGFLNDVFLWMKEEASKYKTPGGETLGGICIDEMSIQEDLCMVKTNGEVRLVGFIELGTESDNLRMLCTGKGERPLATHVLQFLYLGLNGFRFPFACFPVTQTKAGDLHFIFWQAVKYLNMYNFKVLFVSMDGAQVNRDFMRMFFSDTTPLQQQFSTKNIWSPNDADIIFIMDFSHVIKRVRNNIIKSGDGKSFVRNLSYNQHIYWEHWVNAFRWDRETNAFPLHRKLSNEHMFLTQESKMRNKLAEDVLDCEMLNLMECFQKSLGDDGYLLNDSIALLKATSSIVKTFRDRRPIHDIEDLRLDCLSDALSWFNQWEAHIKDKTGLTANEKDKMLLSTQTREDLNSCITGFNKLCKETLKDDRHSIVPARVNSDVIENIFCQQRGIINGNNTNPTFYQYVKNINTVIIGQNTVSKNSNAFNKGCEPICFNVDRPVKVKPKSLHERKPLSTLSNGNN